MKHVFFAFVSLCTLTSSFIQAEETRFTEIPDKGNVPILTPDLAGQKTKKIKLSNGLEAYLISDPKADKSGATLSVRVGSWDEPNDNPGLAHYLEHLLFLGTKKYPEESGYQQYISENGGSANAFTTNSFTSYIFSVNNNAFPQALDRFAQFFIEPLFNPSGVARELNAIEQEYAKNLENDDVRLMHINKKLGNPEHPYNRFNMGNRSTLQHVERSTLEKWYQQHYSANLMRLVVYSNKPLNELEELVVNDFSPITSTNQISFTTDKPALAADDLGKMILIEPVQNQLSLTLLWELPLSIANMNDSQPERIVCFVLGHEGEESLLAELKRQHLAETLQCGHLNLGAKNSVLYLEVGLTAEGVKRANDVAALCFEAIANLKQKGIPQYIFDEMQSMEKIEYQYQPREDAFNLMMKHARWISEFDFANYPEQRQILQKFDPEAIQTVIATLTPQQAHIYLTAPASELSTSFDQTEKWTHAKYTIKPIDSSIIQKWENTTPNPKIDLPVANPFIPQNLALSSHAEGNNPDPKNFVPQPAAIITGNDNGQVFFASDSLYKVPEIYWYFEIKTPQVDAGNPAKTVLADLYARSVQESLKKLSYPASIAGLSYQIKRSDFGIVIVVGGYRDKAELLMEEIIKRLRSVQVTENEFQIYKESLLRDYQNGAKQPPATQAIELIKTIIYKRYAPNRLKALAIQKITLDKFNDYLFHLYDQSYVEGMLYGDMTKDEAQALTQKLTAHLDGEAYPRKRQFHREVIILPKDQGPFYLEATTKAQGNAVILALQHPYFDFKMRAAQQILMQGIEQSFFATLRTKQQTGYIVFSDEQEIKKQLFDFFGVQSNSHSVRDLLARFELFLETYLQELEDNFTEERFNTIKASVLEALETPPKSITEMGDLLEKLAFDHDADFDWVAKRIQGVKELTYAEFLKMSRQVLSKQNKQRAAVLLKGQVPEDAILEYAPIRTISRLRKLSEYTQ